MKKTNLPAIPKGADMVPVNKDEMSTALGSVEVLLQKTHSEMKPGGTLGDFISTLWGNTMKMISEPEQFKKEYEAIELGKSNQHKQLTDGDQKNNS